ncbi:MAG: transcription antitermination factor NusB [Thermoleophilia bacterium]|nr:transcription antitermination factor NusB [Thermoleophilia bacterium]
MIVLYQQDLLGLSPTAAMERLAEERLGSYARQLVEGVGKEREDIDRLLGVHVAGWTLDRLGVLERAILRCATYELFWEKEVPQAVAIDEAVNLAKRFCSPEAGALVNGVLGSLVERGGPPSGGAARSEELGE